MNVLFYMAQPFIHKKHSGDSKYIWQHLRQLVDHGNKCTMFCPLTGKAAGRQKALEDLRSKGHLIKSEEFSLMYIDKIVGEPFDVITYTFKSFRDIPTKEKLGFPWISNFPFSQGGSSISKNRKSFFSVVLSAFRYGKGFRGKLALVSKWWHYYCIEVYLQSVIKYYKGVNQELNPDFILLDGYLELMEIVIDFYDVTELKKPKIVPVISTSIITNFGPMAMNSTKQTMFKESRIKEVYNRMDGFVLPSNYLKNYLLRWTGLDLNCQVVYPLIENDEKYLNYKAPKEKEGYVTLINGTNYKGLPIFIALAKKNPDVNFMVVTSWGKMGKEQYEELKSLSNVKIMESVSPVDPVYDMTKVLLVPSLWDEAFGMVVVEAMLRGIPVLGSDVGGIPEAKLGVDFLLPVNPYKGILNNVPPQKVEPWAEALQQLLSSKEVYRKLSEESQTAAQNFIRRNKGHLLIDGFRQIDKELSPQKS